MKEELAKDKAEQRQKSQSLNLIGLVSRIGDLRDYRSDRLRQRDWVCDRRNFTQSREGDRN